MSQYLKSNNKVVEKISKAMVEEEILFKKNAEYDTRSTLVAGYTYLGQLISHEIVPPTNPDISSRVVSGKMSLESIYGTYQNYELLHPENNLFFNSEGKFKFSIEQTMDFKRNESGTAIIAEQRNDENIIIAQFHLFWQRLHNCLLDNGFAVNAVEAKTYVILIFQLVVVEDYLNKILDPSVYIETIVENINILPQEDKKWEQIFRFATFRFGHSTVRNSYQIRLSSTNEGDFSHFKDLKELFLNGRSQRDITDLDNVDWQLFFFENDKKNTNYAMSVDTHIEKIMKDIPNREPEDIASHIVQKNIFSELKQNLPTGVDVAWEVRKILKQKSQIDLPILNRYDIQYASFNNLIENISDLTIWLYILLEAQRATGKKGNETHQLGVLASVINAEVIKHSIQQASVSIYQNKQYQFNHVFNRLNERWRKLLKAIANDENCSGKDITMKNLLGFLNQHERRR